MNEYLIKLNSKNQTERLNALKRIIEIEEKPNRRENDANNHIHTIYSFSPYSPTKAAYMAYRAGLTSAGIMDHDTLSGADEFRKACEILGLGSTTGVEVRCKFNRGYGKINHPDQKDCVYMAAHGVPKQNVKPFNEYLQFYRDKRNERNQKMCKLITEKYSKFGISLDFERDVVPLSMAEFGGSITERHLLYALSIKLENKFNRTEKLVEFLQNDLGLEIKEGVKTNLLDNDNEHFLYDLLGVLKADTGFFYIDADEEMPNVDEFVKIAKSFGAIPAYAYLGDVGNSITGDKKAQKFEDDFLPELITELKEIGFDAVAYMPTRNTKEQLERLTKLLKENQLFEISGEDINSPRQKFFCKALAQPEYSHLISSTWALIGHERITSEKGIEFGMFSKQSVDKQPNLNERINDFAKIGRKTIKK